MPRRRCFCRHAAAYTPVLFFDMLHDVDVVAVITVFSLAAAALLLLPALLLYDTALLMVCLICRRRASGMRYAAIRYYLLSPALLLRALPRHFKLIYDARMLPRRGYYIDAHYIYDIISP